MDDSRIFDSTAAAIDYIQSFRWEGVSAQQLQRECRKQSVREKQASVGNESFSGTREKLSQHEGVSPIPGILGGNGTSRDVIDGH